jgi:hypothetical protein
VKTTLWALTIVACGCLAFGGAGCKKGAAANAPPQSLQEGVKQLRAALLKASPEVQSNLYSGVVYNVHYAKYPDALAALERIAGDPGLDAGQKKLVNDVTQLVKAKIGDEGASK